MKRRNIWRLVQLTDGSRYNFIHSMLIGWRMGRRRERDDVIDFVFSSFRCRFGRWTATSPSTVWRSILIVGVWLGVRTGKRTTSTEELTPQGNQRKTWQSLGRPNKWRYLKLRKCVKRYEVAGDGQMCYVMEKQRGRATAVEYEKSMALIFFFQLNLEFYFNFIN